MPQFPFFSMAFPHNLSAIIDSIQYTANDMRFVSISTQTLNPKNHLFSRAREFFSMNYDENKIILNFHFYAVLFFHPSHFFSLNNFLKA
jgi:hypothetical protein